ncbi:DNA-binding transcriptional MerR regulator [Amycolatopsis sulphurea]|uniref:DNA-binding transcriptional MerR regulator n=2 Tax=Amycolatopsis sulphurea TaxID=76022 RepID=A0A2A9G3E4_9PSEU|nr:DNA-binding transcriptional MerR regulator [Amycolatopsis sulphurea]
MDYRVGEVAAFAGITVRTVHHYDEIGLLSPSGRSAAGYRRYRDADLDRLQRVLLYRELGLPLETIATLLSAPEAEADAHLRWQRELLVAKADRVTRMVAAVDRVPEARAMGSALTPEEKFEVFGGFREPEGYPEEAAQRWGDTPGMAARHAARGQGRMGGSRAATQGCRQSRCEGPCADGGGP